MENHLEPIKVLVVDDDKNLLGIIAEILIQEGMLCETSSEPKLVLEVINDVIPDILLMDISMPGLDGRNICQQIKKSSMYFKLPVILISGSPMDAESVADAGADDFIQKPFDNQVLVNLVYSYVQKI